MNLLQCLITGVMAVILASLQASTQQPKWAIQNMTSQFLVATSTDSYLHTFSTSYLLCSLLLEDLVTPQPELRGNEFDLM
jgi:hypothetical protein